MEERVILFFLGVGLGLLISQRRVARVTEEASTDTLTGLYNRAFLDKTLGRLLASAKREEKPLTLMMIDLNHFKEANDRFGHLFGDKVLRLAAQSMVGCLRAADFIFRYGGDEFMVILPNTSSPGAIKVAEKIRKTLDGVSLRSPQGNEFSDIGASIGIATYPGIAATDAALIKAADEAVYRAKDKRGHIEVAP